MFNRVIYILAFTFLVAVGTSHAADDELRKILFKETDILLTTANANQAKLLAPKSYTSGIEYYTSATERFEKGQKIEKIKKDLTKSSEYLQQSIDASELARVTLTQLINARTAAVDASAEQYAAQEWQEAEEIFLDATAQLESGRLDSVTKIAEKGTALFKQVELSAIKVNYLNETRQLIAEAKKTKVDRYAPITLSTAKTLLSKADNLLSENRYDADEPRAIAREAIYEARHANHIAEKVRAISKKESTTEELILSMEKPIIAIASSLNLKAELDGSVKNPTEKIHNSITALQKDSLELIERRQEVAALEKELAQLELRLGVQSERLAIQEARNKKIAQIETLFSPEEATVLKKGEAIILRMVGLNFESGKATINPEYDTLLSKLHEAINIFSDTSVYIEGHTDSFGGDEFNLDLSRERAVSVRTYLLDNFPVDQKITITATGYGETQPIGNNETIEGRKNNRRIDVVIRKK
jgi:outer membrane protein OmpA-like peptidoglycan-associated protein